MEEPFLVLDIDQFLVLARFDVNENRISGAPGGHGHDRLLHSFELSAAIGGDDQIGWRARAATRSDQKEH